MKLINESNLTISQQAAPAVSEQAASVVGVEEAHQGKGRRRARQGQGRVIAAVGVTRCGWINEGGSDGGGYVRPRIELVP